MSIQLTKTMLSAALLSLSINFAYAASPTESSVKQLLLVTESKKLIDTMPEAMEKEMLQSIAVKQKNKPMSAEDQQMLKEIGAITNAYVRENFTWRTLEPEFIKIYMDNYTQEEVDAMIAFYSTPVGKSIVGKLPAVVDQSSHLVTQRVVEMAPALQKEVMGRIASKRNH